MSVNLNFWIQLGAAKSKNGLAFSDTTNIQLSSIKIQDYSLGVKINCLGIRCSRYKLNTKMYMNLKFTWTKPPAGIPHPSSHDPQAH